MRAAWVSAVVGLLSGVLVAVAPASSGASTDDLECGGRPVTLRGTPAGEVITGTPGPDVIHGLGGSDILRGGGGDDVICGGPGLDHLDGGAGDDQLRGGPSPNIEPNFAEGVLPQWLRGGPGDDVLVGGGGAEWLWGDAGADQLSGRGGDDSLQGGAGDDTMTGGVGDDDLSGGGGRDHIRGGAGDDSLDGGYARDVLLAGPGTDACNGGLGVTDFAGCEHIEPVVIGPAEELHLAERRWGAHRGARYRWEYWLGEPGSVIDYCTRSRVGTSNTGPIPADCERGATVEAMFDVIKLASGWTFVREVRYDELTGRPTYVDAARGVQLREQGFRFLD